MARTIEDADTRKSPYSFAKAAIVTRRAHYCANEVDSRNEVLTCAGKL